MTLSVRIADTRDLDRLAPLFDAYRQFYRQPADLARARDFLAERLARQESLVLLAELDGEAIGFTQLYPLFSSVRTVRTWLLNDLFVAPSARRSGAGRALLQQAAAQARARGAASLSLSTALDNAPAQALYESLGWVRDTQFCEYGFTL
ncbi:GNAT family N-acetyltransferase [Dyella lutea]|uniref:GNAT family N-acetyltransferase n=1 Tax=Dyella lutea TaxID=2950441 RepID=A0ABT1FAT5_9GAMM|nr:GNAT family N-acetyltransferase [Dyella lutea]MCP1374486.1 GNAT family N-acetyltransferase [Dyella lutea]